MINNEHQDLLDRYIRHELTADEQRRVEDLLQSDTDFALQATFMEHTANALDRLGEQKALAEMQAPPRPRTVRKWYIFALSAAATVILLLYIGTSPQYPSQQLFETYYAPLEYEDIPSRSDDVFDVQQQTAVIEAIADFEAGNADIAIRKLRRLSLDGGIYAPDARWYLALIYLQQGKRADAGQLLKQLQQTHNIYHRQATELLMKLNQKKWF